MRKQTFIILALAATVSACALDDQALDEEVVNDEALDDQASDDQALDDQAPDDESVAVEHIDWRDRNDSCGIERARL